MMGSSFRGDWVNTFFLVVILSLLPSLVPHLQIHTGRKNEEITREIL